ncbi:MAG: DUF5103 domain-containing protein [bacterium]|nr:DUF5103 domain-containing protein [Candidatus Kapabacteria bacterium]
MIALTGACAALLSCSAARASSGGTSDSANRPATPPIVRWLRIYGTGNEGNAPVLRLGGQASRLNVGSTSITLELDMFSANYPNLELRLIHCDRNWIPTENIFVQDFIRLKSHDFEIRPAMAGVRTYNYSASIVFPRPDGMLRIQHSGNYLAQIIDMYDDEVLVAETRFFVAEARADVELHTYSDFFDSPLTSVIQKGLRIRVEARPDVDLFATQINAIHLYKWGEWWRPIIASSETSFDDPPKFGVRARWESFLGGMGIAEFFNIPTGNEHRLLDLTDISLYPTLGNVVTTPLSDLPRQSFAEFDNNGVAQTRFVSMRDEDYVYFEFRLDLSGRAAKEDIFVVGTFNDWKPRPEWQMTYDDVSRMYIARGLLRRARHEYQYVAGSWDADRGFLRDEDASLTEGNTSQSTHPYMALVFYRDIGSGGYDRIVGATMGWSGR